MIRVLLVDDEQLVRSGLRMILQSSGDIEVVAEAVDGAQAVERVRLHRPDVVLMDIRMPTMDGLATTRHITALPDPPKIIVLTTFELDEYVHTALQHGAVGFLLKDTPPVLRRQHDLRCQAHEVRGCNTGPVCAVGAIRNLLAPQRGLGSVKAFSEPHQQVSR